MNSREKIQNALDSAEAAAEDPRAEAGVRAAATMLMIARPRVEALLPADPIALDELLEKGAMWMIGLRSDPDPEPVDAVVVE